MTSADLMWDQCPNITPESPRTDYNDPDQFGSLRTTVLTLIKKILVGGVINYPINARIKPGSTSPAETPISKLFPLAKYRQYRRRAVHMK